MALEAVVFPEGSYATLSSLPGRETFRFPLGFDFTLQQITSLAPDCGVVVGRECHPLQEMSAGENTTKKKETCVNIETEEGGRMKKRPRRSKRCKNKRNAESQRMTHIAVERNRRRLINDYLVALRSLMPPTYLHKGDQASIIAGAINFVKELEHLVESLEARKQTGQQLGAADAGKPHSTFAGHFPFAQYSTCSARASIEEKVATGKQEAVTDVKVTMVESHANVKVVSKRRPRQLLKMVVGLQSLKLNILHLNITTIDEMVLHTLCLKVEDDCQFKSVDKIAEAVYQMMGRIQMEEGFLLQTLDDELSSLSGCLI